MALTRLHTPSANLVLDADCTITASSQETWYPVANLLHPWRRKKWKSTAGTGDAWVKFAFSGAQELTAMLAANVRPHTGGTVLFQSSADGSTWDAGVDVTPASFNPTDVIAYWRDSASHLAYRLYFTNTLAGNESVEVGFMYLGVYVEAPIELTNDLRVRRVDPSPKMQAAGGEETADVRAKYHEADAEFQYLDEDEGDVDVLASLFDEVGSTTPMFIALHPDNVRLTFYGTLADVMQWQNQFGFLWQQALLIREAR